VGFSTFHKSHACSGRISLAYVVSSRLSSLSQMFDFDANHCDPLLGRHEEPRPGRRQAIILSWVPKETKVQTEQQQDQVSNRTP
jgi:hypothetical protein